MKIEELINKLRQQIKNKKIIAITGNGGSGKTYLAKLLAKELGASYLNLDSYFLPMKIREKLRYKKARQTAYIPSSTLKEVLERDLKMIKNDMPFYTLHEPINNEKQTKIFTPKKQNVIEGIAAAFTNTPDFKIFVHSSFEVEMKRRIERDKSRKVSNNVKDRREQYESFVYPLRKKADLIIESLEDGTYKKQHKHSI